MVEPKRLLERGGLASELLRAGFDEQPSAAALRKTAIAVGASAVVALSATAATAATGVAGAANGAASSGAAGTASGAVAGGAASGGAAASAAAGVASTAAGTGASIAAASGVLKAAPVTLAFAVKWLAIGTVGGVVSIGAASRLVPRGAMSEVVDQAHIAPTAISRRPPYEPHTPPRVERIVVPPTPVHRKPAHHARSERVTEEPERDPADDAPPAEPSRLDAPRKGAWPLAAEIAFVDRGWQRVQGGDYTEALAFLATYEAAFPDTRLHPEVLFLRMESENRLGHTASAAAAARQIVVTYPKSAQANRARQVLSSVRAPSR